MECRDIFVGEQQILFSHSCDHMFGKVTKSELIFTYLQFQIPIKIL